MSTGKRSPRKSSESVTVQDVARAAGVSAMTVSRVVNGSKNVRESTRQAVLKAVERLQYRPNTAARSLAAGKPSRIGLLYDNPSDSYLSLLLVGALEAARQSGCHMVLEPCQGDSPEEYAKAARRFIDARVQGVVLPPPLSESSEVRAELDASDIPWAGIAMGPAVHGCLNIRIDDYQAARAMTEHLIGLGHRDIAFIRGHPNQNASMERYRGFADAMVAAGLQIDDARVEQGYFTFQSGLVAAKRLLAQRPHPSAIFASNDDMAAAAVGVAHRMGLHVPDDLSIAGFDDTAIATNIWPELTTISQPVSQMAETAVSMLLHGPFNGQEDDTERPEEQILPYELIIRNSTAAPAGKSRV